MAADSNTGIWLAQILTDCEDALSTPVDRAFLQPGALAAWDECGDGGALWVTLGRVTPSPRVPISPGCPPISWDCVVRVSIIRCVVGMDDRGRPPAPSALTADAQIALHDMEEIRDAIAALGLLDLSWLPLGPEGGYAGGEWTGTIGDVC